MPKPCQRCNKAPKAPGAGQRYCEPCKAVREAVRGVNAPLPAPQGPRRIKVETADGLKWCPSGQHEVPISSFKTPGTTNCIPCVRGKALAYRLKAVYNLTPEMYQKILDHQGGVCGICGMKPKTKRLNVDHQHKDYHTDTVGIVRGLICHACNSGVLASARDNPDVLRAAAAYLENPPAIEAIGEVRANPIANGRPRKRRTRRRYR